jgi:acyl carrier protein
MAEPVPSASMSDEAILERFAAIVAASLRVDPARVTRETSLDLLGAESIDVVEITIDVENAFSVLMPERTILDAAADVLGPGVVEQDGRLTETGRRLLLARMPELDPRAVAAGTPVRDVNRLFLRVDVWVRLIRGLLEQSPRVCPDCGCPLVQGTPARVRCERCQREHDLPTGDDLARRWVREWAARELGLEQTAPD